MEPFYIELYFYAFIFLFGLIIGSFLNCLIWRLYKEETVLGRSYCPNCQHEIPWYDNIPVLSYIFLGGTCRYCDNKISIQYPLVELTTGLLFLASYHLSLVNDFHVLELFYYFFIISLAVIIFIFDLRWYLIPISVVIVGIFILILLNLFFAYSFLAILLAMIAGASFFGIQYLLTKGKGIGEGDIWLGALFGAAFPDLKVLFLTLFLTYIIGGLVSLFLLISGKRKLGSKLPLGIFLTLAMLISLFFSEQLLSWYLAFML